MSPINDRYEFAFGETRIRLPLHLLRCTTRSFERAHGHTCTCAGSNKPVEAGCDRLRPPAGEIPARTSNHTSKTRWSARLGLPDALLVVLVEPRRLELLTSSLQRRRSTS